MTAPKKKRRPSRTPKIAVATDMPVGNRNKFRREHIVAAQKIAQLGGTDRDIAEALSVDYATFRRWCHRWPKLREALVIPKEIADSNVEMSLYKNAMGFYVDEEEVKVLDGELVRVKVRKFIKGETMAQQTWLNNRRRDQWSRNPLPEDLPAPETPVEDMTISQDNVRQIARQFALVLRQGVMR